MDMTDMTDTPRNADALPALRNDRRAKFERIIETATCFDFYGLERGGHNGFVRWLLALMAQPRALLAGCAGRAPGLQLYHYTSWDALDYANAKQPESVALTYGPDLDLTAPPSRLPAGAPAVVLVRDIGNMCASRLAWRERHGGRAPFRVDSTTVTIWTAYAQQVLGEADYLGGRPYVGAYFDAWAVSADYRRDVLRRMERTFNWMFDAERVADEAKHRQHVPNLAEGSSFDGTTFDGKADQMQVTSRYARWGKDARIERLLTPEVRELCEKLKTL